MDLNEKLLKLKELTNQFQSNIKQYKSSEYDEANTRVDFIDKLFELLDWDVANKEGYSELYRDVVREDKIQIEGKQKAPDYSFRIGGVRKFFVEAKKPSISIKDDIVPAFQVRRYGYTAKLPLSILTDFEEFAIYDTRIKPDKNDKASVGRVFYCTYEEYEKNFEFICNTFSKGAILKGSFDRYIDENKNKKGTGEVDRELLKLVEDWRTDLAKNIALRNNDIDIYNLNNAVQKIIDRIIFLRIAEDKEIEPYEQLLQLAKQADVYKNLCDIFVRANKKYNAGLFKQDEWLAGITIDDKVLAAIIKGLYYPECPYEFSILPIEILGNIYEQFLGKTIRFKNVKDGQHTAVIEEKPEVRKAGGVYYTPQYIVNYIVENTIGEKIKDKTPDEIAGLTVCDPACGSGSFLVGAYQYLLNYHQEYYTSEKNLKKALKDEKVFQVAEGNFKLTIEEKQKILINNIYGVDIDPQAVEVTKLSLYLKLLENEGKEAEGQLFKHSDMKLLPTLDGNIKCGNSLIGSDFYQDKDLSLFGNEEMRKVNVFDWEEEFPGVFRKLRINNEELRIGRSGSRGGAGAGVGNQESFTTEDTKGTERSGGFDVVIGNPPYFNISTVEKDIYNYLETCYSEIHTGYNDIMYYFMFRGIKLLSPKGIYGVITSNYYLGNSYAKSLRVFLKKHLRRVINFKNYMVFNDASIHTNIVLAEKNPSQEVVQFYDYLSKEPIITSIDENQYQIITILREVLKEDWVLTGDTNTKLIEKLNRDSLALGDISTIAKGSESGKNEIFTFSKDIIDTYNIENDLIRKCIKNSHIKKFTIDYKNIFILYTENNFDPVKYPNAYSYLKKYKAELLDRRGPLHGEYEWHRLHRPSIKEVFDAKEKLVVPYRAEYNRFAYDNEQYFNDGGDIRAIVLKDDQQISIKYILGILNSTLMNWLYGFIGKPKGKMREYFNEPIAKIPIRNIDFTIPSEKAQHDKLVSLVDQMLDAQKKLAGAVSESDKKVMKQRVDLIDKQIDALVYELYGLTEDEIRIVEGE